VKAKLKQAWGYQGDNMNLPVPDLEAAIPFYETVMGFTVESRSSVPHNSAVLVRDDIRIGLAENGGDPTQDGCAFEVDDVGSLLSEFISAGLQKKTSDIVIEKRNDGSSWKVFFVIAPDGLCYWLGEKID
jgi:catechol 2,3-dioxygenase-like lactoylglutathione lyase family enzyme